MKKENFYLMVSEIEQRVADYSCGCMGNNYTFERAKREFESGEHYLRDIFKKYIDIE